MMEGLFKENSISLFTKVIRFIKKYCFCYPLYAYRVKRFKKYYYKEKLNWKTLQVALGVRFITLFPINLSH